MIWILTLSLTIGFAWYNAFVASLFGQTVIPGYKLAPKIALILFGLFLLDVAVLFGGYKFGSFIRPYLKGTEQWVAIVAILVIVIRMTHDFRNHIWQERIREVIDASPTLYASILAVTYALDLGCCACWLGYSILLVAKLFVIIVISFFIFGFIIGYKKRFPVGYTVYQAAIVLLFLSVAIRTYLLIHK